MCLTKFCQLVHGIALASLGAVVHLGPVEHASWVPLLLLASSLQECLFLEFDSLFPGEQQVTLIFVEFCISQEADDLH